MSAEADSNAQRLPILLSWSSGKDSAWALHRLREDPRFEVRGLLTSLNEEFDRVAMHGVRAELLAAQAAAVGLPLWRVDLPHPCTNDEYERRMNEVFVRARAEGIEGIAFGDLFLEDVRAYRERQLKGTGLQPHFPLWGLDTTALAKEMVRGGLRAVLTCVDPKQGAAELVGSEFGDPFLSALPTSVDPCGEKGEFHTFVFDAPGFSAPIPIRRGESVERGGFRFIDLQLEF